MTKDATSRMDPVLDRLFDYTKFHIGLYATVFAASASALQVFNLRGTHPSSLCLLGAMAMFFLAGVCGGKIASNIPDLQQKLRRLSDQEQEEWPGWELMLDKRPVRSWADTEHRCFWIGAAQCFAAVVLSRFVPA